MELARLARCADAVRIASTGEWRRRVHHRQGWRMQLVGGASPAMTCLPGTPVPAMPDLAAVLTMIDQQKERPGD